VSCVFTEQHEAVYRDDISKQHKSPYTECPRRHRTYTYLPCEAVCAPVYRDMLWSSKVACRNAVTICMYRDMLWSSKVVCRNAVTICMYTAQGVHLQYILHNKILKCTVISRTLGITLHSVCGSHCLSLALQQRVECAWSYISWLVMLYVFINAKVSDKAVNVLFHPHSVYCILHFMVRMQDFIVCGKSPVFCRVSSQRNGLYNAKQ
jgi:hypothetical protein